MITAIVVIVADAAKGKADGGAAGSKPMENEVDSLPTTSIPATTDIPATTEEPPVDGPLVPHLSARSQQAEGAARHESLLETAAGMVGVVALLTIFGMAATGRCRSARSSAYMSTASGTCVDCDDKDNSQEEEPDHRGAEVGRAQKRLTPCASDGSASKDVFPVPQNCGSVGQLLPTQVVPSSSAGDAVPTKAALGPVQRGNFGGPGQSIPTQSAFGQPSRARQTLPAVGAQGFISSVRRTGDSGGQEDIPTLFALDPGKGHGLPPTITAFQGAFPPPFAGH
mmetsp:Transcript_59517/g.138629  ORF Transcript_59517/g.138629 Transcript_59517/m.138629 type:complete len:282 (-) Transcript_59517:217-1062(-)